MKKRILTPWAGRACALALTFLAAVVIVAPSARAQFAQGTGGGTALFFDGALARFYVNGELAGTRASASTDSRTPISL